MLRKAGIWAGRLRRMAADLRAQSGIDDLIRHEGLDRDIAEIRKLARGEIEGVVASTKLPERREPAPRLRPNLQVDAEREWPKGGADSYGALPEHSNVYAGELPGSELAKSALYTTGVREEAAAAAARTEEQVTPVPAGGAEGAS